MRENPDNVVMVCKDCSEQSHKDWQEENKGVKIEKGDSIKAAFSDENGVEHLWVTVKKVIEQDHEKVYIGKIDNIPMLVKLYRYKQRVKIGRHEIENHIKREGGQK